MELNELCEVYSGYAFKKFNNSSNGIPVIKIGNILSDGNVDLDNCVFTEEKPKDKFYSRKGDIYIALSGATTGKVAIMNSDNVFAINQRVGIVRNQSCVPNDYLKYFLISKSNQILKEAAGCAQPNISPKQISRYDIPILSEMSMRSISDKLNKIKKVITSYETELDLLDDLTKARFVEMFGLPVSNSKQYPIKKMKEIAPVVQYNGEYSQQVWLLNLDMVESQTGRVLDYNMIDLDDVGNSTCKFDTSNVLYSKLRPYLNKVVIPDKKGYATSELVPLQPKKDVINREYLAYLLRSDEFVGMINEKVAGAKMPRVSMSEFREFNVPIPPLSLQNQFADFVRETDKSRLVYYPLSQNYPIFSFIADILHLMYLYIRFLLF